MMASEILLPHQAFHWLSKYTPLKPVFFNKVKMGFDWNQFNQVHYDAKNPPPKVIQGYRFNLFYPELADKEKATELISAFEEKHELADLVKEQMSDGENTGIQVYIGDEMPIQTMKDCSIVTARYELGDGMYGTIGIIGPKRMDYENVVDSLKELKNHLDGVLKKKT